MRCVSFVLVACLAACGSKPRPRPPAAEVTISGLGSFAGFWVAYDDLDFGYRLTITADGQLFASADRGKLGKCEQRGHLAPAGSDPHLYRISYSKDDCAKGPKSRMLTFEVRSFTGNELSVAITAPGQDERRTYQRDPNAGTAVPVVGPTKR